ncbi:DUF4214 domain-containing protein [Pseudomonas helleri]|uniref:DUF4214 domain-containing protein n=1 Tax=Pseudomonas helleri TaxID=1608996 RepID=A0A7X2CB54_9PSED|nr:DUF4214 domain-containing protein [Pseudomonas helleri]MQU19299.1 DUF4214 domain-containing protein [Pseudomonas helleri]
MAVVTTQQKVAALYTAIFNRAPDQAGLNFWTAQINAGTSFASIAAGFAQHEVFTTGIGALDNAGYVSALYTNILGSAGDTAGIAYWTARLAAGESKAAIVAEFVNGSLTIDIPALLASGGISAADAAAATIRQQTLTNKADVGIYFANTLGAASNLNPATVSTSKAGLEADPIYKASQAAIAGVDSTAASVQTAKDAIAVAAGSANPAEALLGHTFTLTPGADTFVGSASNDTFNALTIKADGSDANTLTSFDSIDGGAGNDTLNIYSDSANNVGLKGATVKNVETINFFNSDEGTTTHKGFGPVDASQFVGATAINQINIASDVSNLAAGAVAGFNGVASPAGATALSVGAAAGVASATVNLTGFKGVDAGTDGTFDAGDNTAGLKVSGAALNSVTVTGSLAQAVTSTVTGQEAKLTLNVVAGKDVESVSINTAVNSELKVSNAGGKVLSTVDASASTGNIDLDTVALSSTVATVKTGSGADKVGLATSLNATVKAASVSTGAGNDTINVEAVVGTVAAGQTVAVDAGEGDDVIQLDLKAGVGYNIVAGAGDDTVTIDTGTVKTTDVIDGGAGTDTIALAGQIAYAADDYIVLNKVLKNFEAVEFKTAAGATTAFDASQVAGYKSFTFDANGQITKVAADQALTTAADLKAVAAGYVAGDSTASPAATTTTYAGSLNVTAKGGTAGVLGNNGADGILGGGDDVAAIPQSDATVNAFADSVALTIKATTTDSFVGLTGDVKSATVNLVNSVNSATAPTADTIAHLDLTTATTATNGAYTALGGLTSLTLSGNGSAVVTNVADAKLTTVDASGLGGTLTLGADKGAAIAGLTYTSSNAAAETIKLGAGIDNVTLNASTYGKMDVVTGLNLVASAADAKVLDAKSDVLNINGVDLLTKNALALGFTTTQTDLDLALKDAAAYANTNGTDVAFHMGDNTYVFHDAKGAGASVGLIDAADTVVQITGQVNLDLLTSSLAHVA